MEMLYLMTEIRWINSKVKYLINENMLHTKIISKLTKGVNLLQFFSPFRIN